jgi:hypothetical protein
MQDERSIPIVSDPELFHLATQILEIRRNCNLLDFLKEIWGNVVNIESIALGSVEVRGDEEISGIQVWDSQGQLVLPDLSLAYWTEVKQVREERAVQMMQDLEDCETDEARLEVVNEYLYGQRVFKEMELPDPKSGSPFFRARTRLSAVPLEYPAIYRKQKDATTADVLELAGNLSYQPRLRPNAKRMAEFRLLLETICDLYECENAQIIADWHEVKRGSSGEITYRSSIALYRDGADWAEEENGHYEGIGLLFYREDVDQTIEPYTTVYRVHIPASVWQDTLLASCSGLIETLKCGHSDKLTAIQDYLESILNDQTAWKALPDLLRDLGLEDEVEEE